MDLDISRERLHQLSFFIDILFSSSDTIRHNCFLKIAEYLLFV